MRHDEFNEGQRSNLTLKMEYVIFALHFKILNVSYNLSFPIQQKKNFCKM